MSDQRNTEGPDEPITGNDQTNGLAPGLDGDDGGAVDPTPHSNVIGDVIRELDPDQIQDEGEDGETSYSEEGQP